MPVLINFKICDNVPECPCIEVCGVKAIFWDESEKKLKVDNSKCTNCRLCEKECPVEAMRVAKTDEEFEEIKKEIEEDERKISDLFVDRYGAKPVNEDTLITEEKFKERILGSKELVAVEFFKEDLLECLINSIPVKKLFAGKDIKYRKLEIKKSDLDKRFDIKELPTLLLFKDGKLLGKIEGYLGKEKLDEMKKKVDEILN